MLVIFQCIKSVTNILNSSPKHFVFRQQHQCHPFLERQHKSENCYGSRSKFAAKMCDDKLFQIRYRKEVLSFSAKLTWKWRNYIILNNCIKIFHFKYFNCDEIILILFSPLSKLIPQVTGENVRKLFKFSRFFCSMGTKMSEFGSNSHF